MPNKFGFSPCKKNSLRSESIFFDNNSAIQLAKNINIKYHLIQYHVEAKTIQLKHCSTEEQIADIFTKALGCVKFEQF